MLRDCRTFAETSAHRLARTPALKTQRNHRQAAPLFYSLTTCAVVAIGLLGNASPASAERPEIQVLKKQGDDAVHTYRIPGIATTNRGTLLAIYDLRKLKSQN